jgi:hypothetical protein
MEFLIRWPRLAKIRTHIIDLRVTFEGNYELDALKINAAATIIAIMNEEFIFFPIKRSIS